MKYLIAFFLLFTCVTTYAQDTIKRTSLGIIRGRLDTNEVIYDEQGKTYRYYQYQRLVNLGEYTLFSSTPYSKQVLKKLSVQQQNAMYETLRRSGTIKSPVLQESSSLNVTPLLDVMTKAELDNKVVVLIFWHPECPPCTESFADINDFLKQIHNPEDLVVMAITTATSNTAIAKLKEKPLLYTQFINNARPVYFAYQLNVYPSYVVTDKNHVIRFASTGASPVILPAFKSAIKAVLQQ